MELALLLILVAVFVLPVKSPLVEGNLEPFLAVAGATAAIAAGVLTPRLISHALGEPLAITAAVTVAGLLFKWFRDELEALVPMAAARVRLPALVALLTIGLGLVSSMITAIIASLLLASFIHAMRLHRSTQAWIAVPGCFAIGFGAVLTPIGEPLSTIVTSKLSADFWYLARLLGPWAVLAVLLSGVVAAVAVSRGGATIGEALGGEVAPEGPEDAYHDVAIRALRVYVFVVGLALLGAAYQPLVDRYLLGAPGWVMYGAGLLSSVLDNATLAAAAISPSLEPSILLLFMVSLMASGGILIPGNVPNIVAAGRLRIGSKAWARIGVPLGLSYLVLFGLLLAIETVVIGRVGGLVTVWSP